MSLSEDQFREHLDALESQGISFPTEGMVSFNRVPIPARNVSHRRSNFYAHGWYTSVQIPDERNAENVHHLSVSTGKDNRVDWARFTPMYESDNPPEEGNLRYASQTPASHEWRNHPEQVTSSIEEFGQRLPQAIQDFDAASVPPKLDINGGKYMENTEYQPLHAVTHWSDDPRGRNDRLTEFKYDPRTRDIMDVREY